MSDKKLSTVVKQRFIDFNCSSVFSLIGIVASELSDYDFDDACKVLEDIRSGNIDSYI